jgi:hypothetical protein
MRDSSELEFNGQALLIDRLQEPATLLLVDLEARPHDLVTFIPIKNFHALSSLFFVPFVLFVVHSSFSWSIPLLLRGDEADGS